MDHLQSRLINAAPPSTSISFESVATLFDYSPSFFYGMVDPLRTTVELLSVYETLSITADGTSVSARAQKAVLQLFQLGWKLEDVGRLVVGISLPLREAIRLSQLESPDDWPPEAYELIRRPDLARQNGGKAVERHKHVRGSLFARSKETLIPVWWYSLSRNRAISLLSMSYVTRRLLRLESVAHLLKR